MIYTRSKHQDLSTRTNWKLSSGTFFSQLTPVHQNLTHCMKMSIPMKILWWKRSWFSASSPAFPSSQLPGISHGNRARKSSFFTFLACLADCHEGWESGLLKMDKKPYTCTYNPTHTLTGHLNPCQFIQSKGVFFVLYRGSFKYDPPMENFSWQNFNSDSWLKKKMKLGFMKNSLCKGNTGSCATECCTIVSEAISSSICLLSFTA